MKDKKLECLKDSKYHADASWDRNFPKIMNKELCLEQIQALMQICQNADQALSDYEWYLARQNFTRDE